MDLATALAKLNSCNDRGPILSDALHAALRTNDQEKILEARRAISELGSEKARLEEHINSLQVEARRATGPE